MAYRPFHSPESDSYLDTVASQFESRAGKSIAAGVIRNEQQEQNAVQREQQRAATQQRQEQERQQREAESQRREQAREAEAVRARGVRAGAAAGIETETDVETGKRDLVTHPDGAFKYKPESIGDPVVVGEKSSGLKDSATGETRATPSSTVMVPGDGALGALGGESETVIKQPFRDDRGNTRLVEPDAKIDKETGVKYVEKTDPATGLKQKSAVGIDADTRLNLQFEEKKRQLALRENAVNQHRLRFNPKWTEVKGEYDKAAADLNQYTDPKSQRFIRDTTQEGAPWMERDPRTGTTKTTPSRVDFELDENRRPKKDAEGQPIPKQIPVRADPRELAYWQKNRDEAQARFDQAKKAHDQMLPTAENLNRNEREIKSAKLTYAAAQARGDRQIPDEDGGAGEIIAKLTGLSDETPYEATVNEVTGGAALTERPTKEPEAPTSVPDVPAEGEVAEEVGPPSPVAAKPILSTVANPGAVKTAFAGLKDIEGVEVEPRSGWTALNKDGKWFGSLEDGGGSPVLVLRDDALRDDVPKFVDVGATSGIPVYTRDNPQRPKLADEVESVTAIYQALADPSLFDPVSGKATAAMGARLAFLEATPADIISKVQNGTMAVQHGEALLKNLYGTTLKAPDVENPDEFKKWRIERSKAERESGVRVTTEDRYRKATSGKLISFADQNQIRLDYLSDQYVRNHGKPGFSRAKIQALMAADTADGASSGEKINSGITAGGRIGASVLGSMLGLGAKAVVGIGAAEASLFGNKEGGETFDEIVRLTGRDTANFNMSAKRNIKAWTTEAGAKVSEEFDDATKALRTVIDEESDKPAPDKARIAAAESRSRAAALAMHQLSPDEQWPITDDDLNPDKDPALGMALARYKAKADPREFELYKERLLMGNGRRQMSREMEKKTARYKTSGAADTFGQSFYGGMYAGWQEVGAEIISDAAMVITAGGSKLLQASLRGVGAAGKAQRLARVGTRIAAGLEKAGQFGLKAEHLAEPLTKLQAARNAAVRITKTAGQSFIGEAGEEVITEVGSDKPDFANAILVGGISGVAMTPLGHAMKHGAESAAERAIEGKIRQENREFAGRFNSSMAGVTGFQPINEETAAIARSFVNPQRFDELASDLGMAQLAVDASDLQAKTEAGSSGKLENLRGQIARAEAVLETATPERAANIERSLASMREQEGALLPPGDSASDSPMRARKQLDDAIGAMAAHTDAVVAAASEIQQIPDPSRKTFLSGVAKVAAGNSASLTQNERSAIQGARTEGGASYFATVGNTDVLTEEGRAEITRQFPSVGALISTTESEMIAANGSAPATVPQPAPEDSPAPVTEPANQADDMPLESADETAISESVQRAQADPSPNTPEPSPVNPDTPEAPAEEITADIPTNPEPGDLPIESSPANAEEESAAWRRKLESASIESQSWTPPEIEEVNLTLGDESPFSADKINALVKTAFDEKRPVSRALVQRSSLDIPENYIVDGAQVRLRDPAPKRNAYGDGHLRKAAEVARRVRAASIEAMPRLSDAIEIIADDSYDFTAGAFANSDGSITINLADIASNLAQGSPPRVEADILTNIIVRHEAIHAAQFDAMRRMWERNGSNGEFGDYFMKAYGVIGRDLSKNPEIYVIAKQIYDSRPAGQAGASTWDNIPEWARAAEAVRMIAEALTDTSPDGEKLLSEVFRAKESMPHLMDFFAEMMEALTAWVDRLVRQDIKLSTLAKTHLAELLESYESLKLPLESESTNTPNPQSYQAGRNTRATLTGKSIGGGWNSFNPKSETLGIPRAEMPQIKAEDRSSLVQFLRARGVDYSTEEVLPGTLKPTQAEYSPQRVRQAREFEGGNRSILVSADHHVLDGHHQWMAELASHPKEPIPIIRLDAPIAELIPLVKEMPIARAETPETMEMPAGSTPQGGTTPAPLELERQPGVTRGTSAPEVIKSIGKVLKTVGGETPLRIGRMKGKRALGEYFTRQGLARIKTANDIPTAAHELGHALQKSLFGFDRNAFAQAGVSPRGIAELDKLGRALYGDKVPAGGYLAEGFAEWFSLRIYGGKERATTAAPDFSKFFENGIEAKNEAFRKALAVAEALGDTWRNQGSKERAIQSIYRRPGVIARTGELLAEFAKRSKADWIDAADPIAKYVQEATAKGGKEIAPAQDPFATLTALRLSHSARAEYMVENSMIDFAGNPVGKGLKDVLAPVRGKKTDFLIFMWAKRAIALLNDPEGARNPGLTMEDAVKILDDVSAENRPLFERVASEVYKWNDQVLNYAGQASPDYKRVIENIRQRDPGFYIPLFREFNAFDQVKKIGGSAASGKLLNQLRGSGRRIKDPFEGMIAQASALVLKAHQKRVLDQILRIADTVPDLGNLVMEVPQDRLPTSSHSIGELILEINSRIAQEGGTGIELTPEQKELTEEVLTFFAPAYKPAKPGEHSILPTFRDGKMKWYEVDEGLYRTLAEMDGYRLPKILDLFLGMPARTFRLGTTGLRASFSLVTNPLRDFRTLHYNSKASANSAELFTTWMQEMGKSLVYAATGGKVRPDSIDAFERIGGKMATPLGQDTRPTERAARRLFETTGWRIVDIRNWADFARDILQFPEMASRTTEMRLIGKDTGWKPGMPMDEETAIRLLTVAKQVTTDFTAAGRLAKVANQAIPFFNAGIQGPRAHVRAIKDHPAKFSRRALYGTALALGLWFQNKDEEWWKEMRTKDKFGFTYIPFERDGKKELLRIPRAFEADGIFMAGAQALADAWYQKDPKAATEWFTKWAGDLVTPGAPVLASLTAEQLANENFYSGSPIVPMAEENMPAEEQVGPYTSRASELVGQLTNTSPLRIDHAIRSLFGGAGSDLVALTGQPHQAPREKELVDLPIFGTLFVRGGQSKANSESINQLYDALEDAEKIQNSSKKEETVEQIQLRLLLTDAQKAAVALSQTKRLEFTTGERRRLDDLKNNIARDAVAHYRAGNVDRSAAHAARLQAEAILKVKKWEAAQARNGEK